MKTAIGIVILDLNQSIITSRCLRSLAQGRKLPEATVVVQNGSQFPWQQQSSDLSALKIVTLQPERNLGCAGGRNLGLDYLARNSDVGIFVILDNDVLVPNDFIEQIANLELNPLEVIAPIIFDSRTHHVWSCGGTIAVDGSVEQLTDMSASDEGITKIVDWAPGACLIMSRNTWKKVGSFDDDLSFYFEDIEWCLRLRRIGGSVIVRKDLTLLHEPHQSLGGDGSPIRLRLWAKNGSIFLLTHVKPGLIASLNWFARELSSFMQDLKAKRASWALARLQGLIEGVDKSIRRQSERRRNVLLQEPRNPYS